MSFLEDFLPIFKKNTVVFENGYKEKGDIYTFIFQKPKDMNWKSGQHGIFSIADKKINKPTRAFSIASSAQEDIIKISMKISENPSEFKKEIMNLNPGMKMIMRGPIGPFHIIDERPALFIAGGIGITPYRALLKEQISNTGKKLHSIDLLYLDSSQNYIYKDEFDKISDDQNITIKYLIKREDLSVEMQKFIIKHKNEANYFVVGSKKMTKSITEFLKSNDISKKNIIKDIFVGY